MAFIECITRSVFLEVSGPSPDGNAVYLTVMGGVKSSNEILLNLIPPPKKKCLGEIYPPQELNQRAVDLESNDKLLDAATAISAQKLVDKEYLQLRRLVAERGLLDRQYVYYAQKISIKKLELEEAGKPLE